MAAIADVWQWISRKNIVGNLQHVAMFDGKCGQNLSDGSHLQQENQRNAQHFKVVVPFAPAQKIGKQSICARNVKVIMCRAKDSYFNCKK
jgi:hypothetical protein